MKRIIILLISMLALIACQEENEFVPFVPEEINSYPDWKTYLEGYKVKDIADAGNILWLTNGKDVMKFNKKTEVALLYDLDNIQKSPDYSITSIACAENGLPWIGVNYTGVLKMIENETWVELPSITEFEFVNVGDILITDNETAWTWMSTKFTTFYDMNSILVRYHLNTVDTFTIDYLISSLAKDNDGNLWIGEWLWEVFPPYYAALVKYDGENWINFNSQSELGPPPFAIKEITFDELGNIWMVGHFGIMDNSVDKLIKFNGTEWQTYDLPLETLIYSLALQGDGTIWLGTHHGLMNFIDSQWTVYDTKSSGLPSDRINSVVVDYDGTKWIGTDKGLVAFNESSL